MANKNSKNSNGPKGQDNKTMQKYEEQRKRINRGAKIMALLLIGAMIVFYVLSAGMFLMD